AAGHGRLALDDDEGLLADLALGHEHPSGLHLELVDGGGDGRQVGVRARREERDLTEVLQVAVGHGGSLRRRADGPLPGIVERFGAVDHGPDGPAPYTGTPGISPVAISPVGVSWPGRKTTSSSPRASPPRRCPTACSA